MSSVKNVVCVLLIALGLLASVFGTGMNTCDQAGNCSPVAESDCGSCGTHEHGLSESGEEAPQPHDDNDSDDSSDDRGVGHHHCQKFPTGGLALPPAGPPLCFPFLSPEVNGQPTFVAPDAPVFVLAEPPRA